MESTTLQDNNTIKDDLDSLLEEKLISFDQTYALYKQIVAQPCDIDQFSISVQLLYYSATNVKKVALTIRALEYDDSILTRKLTLSIKRSIRFTLN